jgi:conjugative transfer region protein TrbK
MRRFGIGNAATAIGLLAMGAAVVMTSVRFHTGSDSQAGRHVVTDSAHADPLARELLRCQAIGMAAKDDAACEAAWAENRRRFFAPLTDQPSASTPDARLPR